MRLIFTPIPKPYFLPGFPPWSSESECLPPFSDSRDLDRARPTVDPRDVISFASNPSSSRVATAGHSLWFIVHLICSAVTFCGGGCHHRFWWKEFRPPFLRSPGPLPLPTDSGLSHKGGDPKGGLAPQPTPSPPPPEQWGAPACAAMVGHFTKTSMLFFLPRPGGVWLLKGMHGRTHWRLGS